MAPDIPKIDADRRLDLEGAAWNFRDEVMRRFFMGNSLSDPKDLLRPIYRQIRKLWRIEVADNPV
jgi:hypothetical protein